MTTFESSLHGGYYEGSIYSPTCLSQHVQKAWEMGAWPSSSFAGKSITETALCYSWVPSWLLTSENMSLHPSALVDSEWPRGGLSLAPILSWRGKSWHIDTTYIPQLIRQRSLMAGLIPRGNTPDHLAASWWFDSGHPPPFSSGLSGSSVSDSRGTVRSSLTCNHSSVLWLQVGIWSQVGSAHAGVGLHHKRTWSDTSTMHSACLHADVGRQILGQCLLIIWHPSPHLTPELSSILSKYNLIPAGDWGTRIPFFCLPEKDFRT